jgi:hypothetical protein
MAEKCFLKPNKFFEKGMANLLEKGITLLVQLPAIVRIKP